MKLFATLTLPLYLLDQFTKWLVLRSIELHDGRTVIPGFFDLVHVTNTGAAFGSFKDGNLFFIVLSLVTLAGLALFAWRGAFRSTPSRVAVALLSAGIMGNVTDRLIHNHVIDFLDFYIGNSHWPAFNVADSCICIATGVLVIWSFREEKPVSEARGGKISARTPQTPPDT